jgi:capsular exopolysaccharide synthesis family protein
MNENNQSIIKHSRSEISVNSPGAIELRTVAPQQLSLTDIWHTIVRRKFAIFGFAATILCLAAAYAYLKTPVYEGVARLEIDPTRSSNLGLDDSDKSTSTDSDSRVKSEVEIIKSSTVAMGVMKSLGLYANPRFAGADTIDANIKDPSQLTPSQRRRLLTRFDDNLKVVVIPNTEIVEIHFRSVDPAVATETANSLIDEYMQRNFLARVDSAAQVSQWLSKQMEGIRANTTIAQQKLADFQKANNLLGADESDNIVTDRLKQLNEELTQAEADRIVKQGRYELARSGDPELIASVVPGTTLQVLRTQQAELQAQQAQLNAKYGSGYPKLRELQSQLASVSSEIDSEGKNVETRLANEYDAAAKAESMIRGDFEKQKAEAFNLNESVVQYAILKHEVESGQQLYDTLQLKVQEAGVTSGLKSSYVNVIDRAELPDKPVEPRKTLYLGLGLGGGLLGGLLLGLVLDSFDDTIKTSEELEAVTALPELGCIPFLAGVATKVHKGLNPTNLLRVGSGPGPISVREPNSPGAEAYRALCSVILLSTMANPPKVLVVTSAMSGEGKSTVSWNLATALAQRGLRILLVDADLRCSSIHTQLGTMPGLSTILANEPMPYRRYRPLSDLPNLEVIPAGFRPTDPTELLASERMQQLMADWSAQYDHVIVDTPPVLPFADSLALSARAHGVILVVRSGVSRSKALLRARDVLSRSGANILGVVLNAVRRPEYYYAYPTKYKELTSSNHQNSPPPKSKATAAGYK